MSISDERLNEMLAGLEGVTPGPWYIGQLGTQKMEHVVDFGPPPKSPFMVVRPGTPAKPAMGGFTGFSAGGVVHADDDSSPANAAHIARCDPDTIRALLTELQSFRAAAKVRANSESDGEWVMVPKAAIDWLDGAAPDADGKWFGDDVPAGKPYWWRSRFRAMIAAATGGERV